MAGSGKRFFRELLCTSREENDTQDFAQFMKLCRTRGLQIPFFNFRARLLWNERMHGARIRSFFLPEGLERSNLRAAEDANTTNVARQMRYTDARSNCFLTFFDCLAYVACVFLCLKHRVEHDPQSIVLVHCIDIFFLAFQRSPTCFRVSCSQLSEQWHPREMHSRQRTLPGTTVNPVHGLYTKLNKHFLSFMPDTLLVSSFACDFFKMT